MKKTIMLLLSAVAAANATVLVNYDFEDILAAGTDSTYGAAVRGYWWTGGVQTSTGTGSGLVNLVPDASLINDGRGIAAANDTHIISTTLDTTDGNYFRFGITIQGLATGETVDLTSITFDYSGFGATTGSGLGLYSDDYSQTLFTADVADDVLGAATADISSSTGLVNGDTLYYRMHFKESATFVNSGGRQVVVDNIAINGTVNTVSVPEPTSLALLGLGGLTLVARRKR